MIILFNWVIFRFHVNFQVGMFPFFQALKDFQIQAFLLTKGSECAISSRLGEINP